MEEKKEIVGKCGWCRHSIGTTSKVYVYCNKEVIQVFRGSHCGEYERAPGADDDRFED